MIFGGSRESFSRFTVCSLQFVKWPSAFHRNLILFSSSDELNILLVDAILGSRMGSSWWIRILSGWHSSSYCTAMQYSGPSKVQILKGQIRTERLQSGDFFGYTNLMWFGQTKLLSIFQSARLHTGVVHPRTIYAVGTRLTNAPMTRKSSGNDATHIRLVCDHTKLQRQFRLTSKATTDYTQDLPGLFSVASFDVVEHHANICNWPASRWSGVLPSRPVHLIASGIHWCSPLEQATETGELERPI